MIESMNLKTDKINNLKKLKMKHRLFMVFGEEYCKIVNTNDTKHFNQIKEEIHIYEFQTVEEMEAFKKGVDEATGHNIYQILSDNDVSKIMETI